MKASCVVRTLVAAVSNGGQLYFAVTRGEGKRFRQKGHKSRTGMNIYIEVIRKICRRVERAGSVCWRGMSVCANL